MSSDKKSAVTERDEFCSAGSSWIYNAAFWIPAIAGFSKQ